MPHKHPRVRVERGLYLAGDTYYAAATPPGAIQRRWKSLGKINLSEHATSETPSPPKFAAGASSPDGRAGPQASKS
jgi:hypothetical protein